MFFTCTSSAVLPNENQDFVEEKFKELDSDQIEGGEFEFLGLEIRFERNKRLNFGRSILNFRSRFLNFDVENYISTRFWISEQKFEILRALCFAF